MLKWYKTDDFCGECWDLELIQPKKVGTFWYSQAIIRLGHYTDEDNSWQVNENSYLAKIIDVSKSFRKIDTAKAYVERVLLQIGKNMKVK